MITRLAALAFFESRFAQDPAERASQESFLQRDAGAGLPGGGLRGGGLLGGARRAGLEAGRAVRRVDQRHVRDRVVAPVGTGAPSRTARTKASSWQV